MKIKKIEVDEWLTVSYEETSELQEQVFRRVVKYIKDTGAVTGESVMQSDVTYLEAPNLVCDIVEMFDFKLIENE